MRSYLTGRITFINIFNINKNTKRTTKNLITFQKKMNGTEESIKEKEHFILLFNIGVTTLNQLLSIRKI